MRITLSGPVRLTLAVLVITLLCAISAGAATEKILHSFTPYLNGSSVYPGPGSSVNPGLVADAAGNLYGMTRYGGTYVNGTVFKLTPNSHGVFTETVLYNFTGGADGGNPFGGLVFDAAGNLYGTTDCSHSFGSFCYGAGFGTIFKLVPANGSWTFSVLYTFTGGSDGSFPRGSLVFDAAGNLYGTAADGGDLSLCFGAGCGTIFKLAPANGSWTFSVLYTFQGGSDGLDPNDPLIVDQAGNLYGTTFYGGAGFGYGSGVVFELKPNGASWTESVLYSFTGSSDGGNPLGSLVFDQAGNLYGTANAGGVGCNGVGCGVVFKLTPDGTNWTESPIYTFTGTDGTYPQGGLVLDQAGNLYGAASERGSAFCGTVFQLTPSSGGWTPSVIHNFKGSDGCGPNYVVMGPQGSILGTAATLGPGGAGLVFELTLANGVWKESTVSPFLGTDAGSPVNSGLIFDSSGNLYGETDRGGTAGVGAIFKLTTNSQGGWTETVLYSFKNTGKNSTDYPRDGLVFDHQGSLYGTTAYGGPISSLCGGAPCGAVFKLTPSGGKWSESVIHTFSGSDGYIGNYGGPLVVDAAGNLYGTTARGGSFGWGTVFELTPSSSGTWTETVLYNFTGGADGCEPAGGVIFDQAGNLYGATLCGGLSNSGAIFKLAPSSGGAWAESVLYSFTGDADGVNPGGPLVLDAAGNLYGAAVTSIFQLSPSGGNWTLNVLYKFTTSIITNPLTLDAAGNLYGTDPGFWDSTNGSVFELTPGSGGWTEKTLYTFAGYPLDGLYPQGVLARDAAGNLYGNTAGGGPEDAGIVFKITP